MSYTSNPLNATFDAILQKKAREISDLSAKNKKTDVQTVSQSSPDIIDTINYSVKTTLYKINAEQDKKLKSSKAYKKKEQLFSS